VSVYDEVHAYGILLIPKGLCPGERRPVLFTQHGLGGSPEDALGLVENPKANLLYAGFGMRLAQLGYVVFGPMISTQSNPERQKLVRRAYLVRLTVVGLEIKKVGRVLDFLSTLPFVDKDRFAFTASHTAGIRRCGPAEPRFKVVICSGHFNDWDLKTTDLSEGT